MSATALPFAGVATGLGVTLAAVLLAGTGGSTGSATAGTHTHTHTASTPASMAHATTKTVDVRLADMRVRPGVIRVPAGTRLRLRVTNADAMQHDLQLAGGAHTPRLGQGETATLDAGVVRQDIRGWCTVPGHRAAGMTLAIKVSDAAPGAAKTQARGDTESGGVPALDLSRPPSVGWKPRDARLAPAPTGTVHRITLRAVERKVEVAPGRRQMAWTFNGSVPGPTLRGKVGDRFEITLVNEGTMGHGVDFHAGALAPDKPMRTIAPGERLVYRFTARRAGAWLYHCSTMPMLQHIGNGMYGAVIIDPPDLRPVAREYFLVAGQLYLGEPGSRAQTAKMREDRPDGWMFNGMAAQYDHAPLTAVAGERVRVWVVNAGPGDSVAFHVVGGQFDTVYKEGAWLLRPGGDGGSQTLDLAPSQGGFAELTFPAPGRYPFVDHDMRHAEAGAHGYVVVRGEQ